MDSHLQINLQLASMVSHIRRKISIDTIDFGADNAKGQTALTRTSFSSVFFEIAEGMSR
jgi:hypothetical protein